MRNYAMNSKYKDNLFRMLFSEKKELLSLYNAVRGTSYTNTDDLEVNTLEGVIYLSLKNDISFVIGGELLLYEHQSSWCGNMPLRSLMYIADLYAGMTEDENLYSTKTVDLPRARFVVFYNGSKELPDRSIQRLSEAYPKHLSGDVVEDLELVVTVLNINKGYNEELMSQCKALREYAIYVDKVREYSKVMPIQEAVEKAIDECIENDVLADFLRKRRQEVAHVSIYEYDAEKHIAQEKEESRLEGGIQKLVSQIIKKVQKSKSLETIADELECEVDEIRKIYDTIQKLGVESSMEEIMKELC